MVGRPSLVYSVCRSLGSHQLRITTKGARRWGPDPTQAGLSLPQALAKSSQYLSAVRVRTFLTPHAVPHRTHQRVASTISIFGQAGILNMNAGNSRYLVSHMSTPRSILRLVEIHCLANCPMLCLHSSFTFCLLRDMYGVTTCELG